MSRQSTHLAAVLLLVPLLLLSACQSQSRSQDLQVIELVILEASGLLVDGRQSSLEDLPTTLEQAIDTSTRRVVFRISCANQLPMARLHAVQDELRSLGLFNVSYRTGSDEALPLVLPSPDSMTQIDEVPTEHFASLHIDASGNVTLEGADARYEELEGMISGRLAADEYLIVSIETDPRATYGDFIRAFGAVKQANATRIHLNDLS